MQNNNRTVVIILTIAVLVLAVVVYQQANRPKTPGEHIDAAISDVGAAVKETGRDIQRQAD
jgi:hypothetical protein